MSQFYSNPKREADPHALPDCEAFYHDGRYHAGEWSARPYWPGDGDCAPAGWYWWPCFPGCMPDGDGIPSGPFKTEADAIADAQADAWDWRDDDEDDPAEPIVPDDDETEA